MKTFFIVLQIALSILLTVLVFLQSNPESDSRSNFFSTVNYQKRGWEKVLFNLTLFVLAAFLISSIIQTII